MLKFIKKLFSQGNKVKDPVCGMGVDPENSKFKSVHQNKEYFFCSENCKNTFDNNPQEFIK